MPPAMPSMNAQDTRLSNWLIEKPNGTVYNLNELGIHVLAYDGVDIPDVQPFTASLALADGVMDLGFRLQPRTWMVKLLIQSIPADYYAARQQLIEIFRPEPSESTLTVTLRDGTVYAIKFRTTGSILSDNGRLDGSVKTVQISIVPMLSTDPTFFNPVEKKVIFYPLRTSGGEPDGLPVPMPVPVPIGPSVYNQFANIEYLGTYPARPVCRIYGPVVNPILENTSTGEALPFTSAGGLVIPSGDWIEIDTRHGIKTIRDSQRVYNDGYLDENNALATFHIGYSGEQNGSLFVPETGVNQFRLRGDQMNENTRVDVSYFERYLGF